MSGSLLLVGSGAAIAGSGFPVDGRLEVSQKRFRNRAGWWPWRSISDFTAEWYIENGQEAVIAQRFDAYAAFGRTMVRTFGNLNWPWFGIAVDWRRPSYWSSLDRLVTLANTRGLYVELNCYGAAEFFANDGEYRAATRLYAEFAKTRPGVFLRLANEPYKNGWTNADDPRLLALADLTASILGHRDFAVGDAGDGNVPVLQTVAQHCNVALVHPTRKDPPDWRWRPWVDHIKAAAEVLPELGASALVLDEPMGAGARVEGKRDDDSDAHLAAMLVAEFCEVGYTYHWIPEENAFTANALPGMSGFAQLKDRIPVPSPAWTFSNTTPVAAITWTGLTGKTRNSLNGIHGWTVAYGEADWSSLQFAPGWAPTERFAGPRIRVVETE